MKNITFPVVVTMLLAACLVAAVVHREQEWFFYGSIILSSAVGSFMGVNGPRFAILGATLCGAIGTSLAVCLASALTGSPPPESVVRWTIFCGAAGAFGGGLFGTVVAAFSGSLAQVTPNNPSVSASESRKRWLRPLLLGVLCSCALVVAWGGICMGLGNPSKDISRFRNNLSGADRILVRDGGFNCCGPTENDVPLFEVTDPSEIEDILANLECTAVTDQCSCCGFPGIDWYKGGQRIALTSLQHGKAIRWDGSKYDLRLSVKSGRWLVRWLVRHGVNEQEIEQGCGGPRGHARREVANKAPSQGESPLAATRHGNLVN